MIRRTLATLSLLCALPAGVASASEAMDKALASIPADAIGFLCVPSIKELDAGYQKAINDLQLQPFVQPPMNSIVGLIKTALPMLGGMDENGPLTVVLMPAATMFELGQKVAILVPAREPKAMIESMNGQSTEDGLWSVNVMGQPLYAAIAKKTLIIGRTADVVQAVKKSDAGINTKLDKAQTQLLGEVSIGLWLDGANLFGKMLKPMADMMLFPMMTGSAPPGSFIAKSAEMNKHNINMFLTGVASIGFGISLDDGGLSLKGAMATIPGSDLAKQVKVKPTTASLLRGLPGRDFVMAFGQTTDPDQAKAAVKSLDVLFSAADGVEGIDQEKVEKLQDVFQRWALTMTGIRGTLELLTPGPGGLIGLSVIIDTSDSGKWLEGLEETVELAKQIALGATGKLGDEDIEAVVGAISLADAEEIDGTKVRHLKIDLSKMNQIDEDDLEEVLAVIGKEGPLLRMAPVGEKQVVLSFGGGKDHMAGLIQSAKKGEALLEQNVGVKNVSTHLPKERASVFYIAADQAIEMVRAVTKAVGEDEFPVQMEPVNAPLAGSVTGADGWTRYDLFLPNELLLAGKNVAMGLMAAQQAPPTAQPPAGVESKDPAKP